MCATSGCNVVPMGSRGHSAEFIGLRRTQSRQRRQNPPNRSREKGCARLFQVCANGDEGSWRGKVCASTAPLRMGSGVIPERPKLSKGKKTQGGFIERGRRIAPGRGSSPYWSSRFSGERIWGRTQLISPSSRNCWRSLVLSIGLGKYPSHAARNADMTLSLSRSAVVITILVPWPTR
jgi:hypothetical protein